MLVAARRRCAGRKPVPNAEHGGLTEAAELGVAGLDDDPFTAIQLPGIDGDEGDVEAAGGFADKGEHLRFVISS